MIRPFSTINFSFEKLKCPSGRPAGDEIGEPRAGAAGEGPAERAVAGIQEKVPESRPADDRHIARRGGAQPGPAVRRLDSPQARKQLPDALRDRVAARRIDFGVIARQLRRARGAQPSAEAPDDDLVRFLGW